MTDHAEATRGIVDLNRLAKDLNDPKPAPDDFAQPRRRRADRMGNGTAAHVKKVGALASEGIAQAYKQVAEDLEAAAGEMMRECTEACERAKKRAAQLRIDCEATFEDIKSRTAGVRRFAKAIETSMAPATDAEMEEDAE